MPRLGILLSLFYFLSPLLPTYAAEKLISSPIAEAFGRQPGIRFPRISPDGTKVVYVATHSSGVSYAKVAHLDDGVVKLVIASKKNKFDISDCRWGNNERLLCTAYGRTAQLGVYYGFTRLVGVNADGEDLKVLLTRETTFGFSQFQSGIVDILEDEPKHVLVDFSEGGGDSVQKLNIYTGLASTFKGKKDRVWSWISDGYGTMRMYTHIDRKNYTWYLADKNGKNWREFKTHSLKDGYPTFSPVGFGKDRNTLYYFDDFSGRKALFELDVTETKPKPRTVYTRNDVDILGSISLGQSNRLVGVRYYLDHAYDYYFDESLNIIQARLDAFFKVTKAKIVDEDQSKNRYLVKASSDTDSGALYLYDLSQNQIKRLGLLHSNLKERKLSPMNVVGYDSRDSVSIPGYLTLPQSGEAPYPTVILPHGGPSSRDVSEFDFLVQFLSAKGYAVLQSNYRGSIGFGNRWEGEGAFKQWRRAVADIVDGAGYLVNNGIADKNKMCIVGWSYGGYAAMLSAIENPSLFKCVGNIAGVTDPKKLADFYKNYVGGRAAKEFIGMEEETIVHGSPLARVEELNVPIFMAYPFEDGNVPFAQGKSLKAKLKKAKKEFTFIKYKHAAHSIRPERYRIDMLTRLGNFLDFHLADR